MLRPARVALAIDSGDNPAMNLTTTHRHRFLTLTSSSAIALLASLSGCQSGRFAHATAEPDYVAVDAAPTPAGGPVTHAQAMQRLIEGNARFVAGAMTHPQQTPAVRTELAKGQAPFAVILGCADSRTSPEVLFDQGLGDLFVARVAGNVIDDHVIGSIEYAVEHLHAPLIVVLGHSKCGAVVAAREVVASDGHAEGHIESLVQAIRPAVEQTIGEDAEATCKANVHNVARALSESKPILHHMLEEGKIKVIGAYYDLESGRVVLLPDSSGH